MFTATTVRTPPLKDESEVFTATTVRTPLKDESEVFSVGTLSTKTGTPTKRNLHELRKSVQKSPQGKKYKQRREAENTPVNLRGRFATPPTSVPSLPRTVRRNPSSERLESVREDDPSAASSVLRTHGTAPVLPSERSGAHSREATGVIPDDLLEHNKKPDAVAGSSDYEPHQVGPSADDGFMDTPQPRILYDTEEFDRNLGTIDMSNITEKAWGTATAHSEEMPEGKQEIVEEGMGDPKLAAQARRDEEERRRREDQQPPPLVRPPQDERTARQISDDLARHKKNRPKQGGSRNRCEGKTRRSWRAGRA